MSTDDECDSNIPLPERSRLNKATCSGVRAKSSNCKQFKQNTRKKSQKQCSRNHSTAPKSPAKNQWMISETPSPYFIGPKKRQSGDRVEQTAHPKRTCLSDRFFISTQNQGKKKNGCVDILPRKQSEESPQHLFSNVRFTLGNKSYMEPTSFNDISTHGSYSTSAATYNVPDMETPSSSSASSSCSSNNQPYFNKKDPPLDDALIRPSTSNYGQDKQKNGSSLCKSNGLGVNFIDTDDSEMHLNVPSNDDDHYQICPFRKVIGKGLRKVLESDEDDDDSDESIDIEDARFRNNYRRGVRLISSDSDDSSDISATAKKSFKKRNLTQLSSTDSNDGSARSFVVYSPTHSRTSALSKKSSSERSSDCSRSKNTRDHSYALRDVTREHTNSSSLSSSTSHSSKNRRDHSYPARGASKRYTATSSSLSSSTSLSSQSNTSSSSADRNTRYPRRESSVRQAISPLTLRVTRSRCPAGLSRSAIGNQSSNGQQAHRRARNFSARFSEVFDPEESSEMEFFTANSDTEASISTVESLGDRSVPRNTSIRSHVTYSVSGSSPSEDEISVIFTTGSAFPDSTSRRVRHRGGGGRRRRTRGPPRAVSLNSTQDLTSVSPDPVEQVRQMEEDEQYARMLQAQFDAEMTNRGEGNETDEVFETSHVSTESDNESAPDSLESILDTEIVPFPPPRGTIGAAIGPILAHSTRGRSRFAVPSNIMFLGGGRRRRGRRSHSVQGDPWMYQFARVLGLSPAYTNPDENEYETLLHFAETIGEEIPRGLRKTEINRLPTRKFYFPGAGPSTSQGYEDIVHKRTGLNKECQVCLSDYENGDVLRILPCFHEFHTPCIDPWLKINHTCPVCRVEVAFEQENLV